MKRIFFILFLIFSFLISHSQVYTFYADSTAFLKRGLLAPGNELIIENATRDKQYGFLQNMWNGRTRFAYAVDTVVSLNDSMIRVCRGTSYFDIQIKGGANIGGGGGSGLTNFSFNNANGFSGNVQNSTTTPQLTISTSLT